MTTMHRRQNVARQRSEWGYQGDWAFPSRHLKYKRPEDTIKERRWNVALLVALGVIDLLILIKVLLILWK